MTTPVLTDLPRLGLGVFDMDDETTAEVVCSAIGLGYRLIDTAAVYGNERGVGEGIRRSGIDRSELFVTTKLWIDRHQDATAAARESLDRLGLEQVDLYLVHWPHSVAGLHREAWAGLVEAQRLGLTRSIGVSNFSATHLDDLAASSDVLPLVNQIELHPLHSRRADRLDAEARGIRVQSWSPLARGQVLDHPVVRLVADAHGATPAQVVLQWHLAHGLHVVAKSARVERLAENLAATGLVLTAGDMAALDGLDRGVVVEPAYYRLG